MIKKVRNRSDVKLWIVICSRVTKPYNSKWHASTCLGYDICKSGNTIEEAYNKLTDYIFKSESCMKKLETIISFKNLHDSPDL